MEFLSEFKTGDRVFPSLGSSAEEAEDIPGTILGWDLDKAGYRVRWDSLGPDIEDVFTANQLMPAAAPWRD